MRKYSCLYCVITLCFLYSHIVLATNTPEIFRLRLYFGLSLPNGGAVSLADWQNFQSNEIATTFDGFNVVDSVGYYKGQPERSKVVTVIVNKQDIAKAKALAARYAKQFSQDSVMVVTVPVLEWEFVGPE